MSIGDQLREARQAQGISLDQAAQYTHIRVHYLEAMEADQFELLPSTAQLRGFLRAYADYLRLDSEGLFRELDNSTFSNPVAATPVVPTASAGGQLSSSVAIFTEIGAKLKSQRELMGLSLGDVERHTHIRMHYIEALETGELSHLPSPVQGRGMLSNYASFLGLDTETILLRFADGLQADLQDRQAVRNPNPTSPRKSDVGQLPARPSQVKRLLSMDLFVGGFIIIFLVGFSVWGALRISNMNKDNQPSPTAPPVSELLLSTAMTEILSTPTQATSGVASIVPTSIADTTLITTTIQPQITETPYVYAATPGLANAPIQVNVVASQRAWLKVITDGETVFEGRVTPGSAYSFAGNERIDLLTGDASSLRVYYNQQDIGVLGSFGEVVERIFTIAGVQTTTPAVPYTSTPAPTSTVTPTPTQTPKGVTSTPTPTLKP